MLMLWSPHPFTFGRSTDTNNLRVSGFKVLNTCLSSLNPPIMLQTCPTITSILHMRKLTTGKAPIQSQLGYI